MIFRAIVSVLVAICGSMLWLWATQLDALSSYIPALICFGAIVIMWLPRPTGRLGEVLSRSLGAVFMLLGIAASLGVVWSMIADGHWTLNKVGAMFLGLVMLAMGWARLFPNYYAPISVDHTDPVMQEAIDRARRELPRLRAALDEGRKQAFIKFPLKSSGGETEHIWGVVHSLSDEAAQVSLVNEPVHEPESKDLRFSVPLTDIEDWTLVDGGGAIDGGYTHVALARVYKREKGFVPHAMRKQLAEFRDLDLSQL